MAKRKRLKTRRARIVVILGLLIVVALAAFFAYRAYSGTAAAEVTYTTGTAEKMTLTSSVSGTGNIVLGDTATVDPSVSGEVTGLAVAVGDKVTAGQTLFTLTNPELDLAVTQAQNAYDQAVLNLSKAELSVLQAKQSLADLEDQYDAQSTTTTLPASTSTTQPVFPSTSSTLPSTTTSTAPGTTSTLPVTTSTTLPETTTTASAGTTTSASSAAVLLSATAASSSDAAQSTAAKITTLDLKAAKQAITSAELSVVSAQTQATSAQLALETAKENAAKRTVTAPMSGTITALNVANGDSVGSSSGSGNNGQSSNSSDSSPITITNLDAFTVSISLAETDISAVELGQKAVITFDALPDLTLTGKVTSVDTVGTNNQGVVSYTVVVTPDITDPSVKGGMTASVNVITKVASDVLAVPTTAVKSQSDGTKYVQVLENGAPSNVTVEVGMSTDSYSEITSGLTEGQEIIVKTVTANSGNTSTTNRNSGGGLLDQGGGTVIQGGPPSGGFSVPIGQ